ncbi:MAG: rhomboid family intramembrane serine protease, partial [Candidatus Thermoplasmatota archaeon]|nr:rhomboid family intramembrane serine protease [Candidatus Thermoplasmatota archaeon]
MGQLYLTTFGASEWLILILWLLAVASPIVYSFRNKTPIALGISVGLLLGYIVQYAFVVLDSYGVELRFVWFDFWLIPNRLDSIVHLPTLFTAGFLHSMNDVTHVLGNVLVIALVGIPLEQRLGTKRFTMIYVAGLLGGSIAWVLFNLGSGTPSWGASGAAYGRLGAYLAGWPKDEIPFPLILIRPWPVTVIALFYFGFELIRAFNAVGLGGYSTVAHMAHIGGFVLSYALLP